MKKKQDDTEPMMDELTEAMHAEFEVDDETEQKHATWVALEAMQEGLMTKKEAMRNYGVTAADIKKYKPEWNKLK